MSHFVPLLEITPIASCGFDADPLQITKGAHPGQHLAVTLSGRGKAAGLDHKVVRYGRYVTFQLAEVAVPRTLFAEILRLIGDLRPRPAPT